MSFRAFRTYLPAVLALLVLAGCQPPAPSDIGPGGNPQSASAPAADANTKIKVEDGNGAVLFVLDPSDKGYQVEDGNGRKLGSIKVEANRVKVSNEQGNPAYKIKQDDTGFKLYREPATKGQPDIELAQYRTDGQDFRIKSPQDQELYRGKAKGAKVKVETPGGQQLDVKEKEDGLEVEDASGKRLIRIKGLKSVAAAAFAAGNEYDTLQKAAVVAYAARIGS